MKKEYIDLLLDNGAVARIELNERDEDAVCDRVSQAVSGFSEWFCTGEFDECSCEVNGIRVDRIASRRIIARI